MATNGKKVAVEISKDQATTLVRALDVVKDQIKRSLAKESDPVIRERREAQMRELTDLANQIAYGGKELL